MDLSPSRHGRKLKKESEDDSQNIKMKFLAEKLPEISSKASLPDNITSFPLSDFLKKKKAKSLSYRRDLIQGVMLPDLPIGIHEDAVEIFKTICVVSGERLQLHQLKLQGDKVVRRGLEVKEMRDEILIQIINQLHMHASEGNAVMKDLREQTWVLLAGCLACFRPSSLLFPYLLNYISREAEEGGKRAPCQHNLLQNFFFSLDDLAATPSSLDERSHPPSLLEWTGYALNASTALAVTLADGQSFHERVNSWMTSEQFASNALIHHLNIPADHSKGWSVTLKTESRSYEGLGHDCLLDLVSELEANQNLIFSQKHLTRDPSFWTGFAPRSYNKRTSNQPPSSAHSSLRQPKPTPPPSLPSPPLSHWNKEAMRANPSTHSLSSSVARSGRGAFKDEELLDQMFDQLLNEYDVGSVASAGQVVRRIKGGGYKMSEGGDHVQNSEEEVKRKQKQQMQWQIELKQMERQCLEASIENEALKNKLHKLEIENTEKTTFVGENTFRKASNTNHHASKQDEQDKNITSTLKTAPEKQEQHPNPENTSEKKNLPPSLFRGNFTLNPSGGNAARPVTVGRIVWPPVKIEAEKSRIVPSKLVIDEAADETELEAPPKTATTTTTTTTTLVHNNTQETPKETLTTTPAITTTSEADHEVTSPTKPVPSPKTKDHKLTSSQKKKIKNVKGRLEQIYGTNPVKPVPDESRAKDIHLQSKQRPKINLFPTTSPPNHPPPTQLQVFSLPSTPILTYSEPEWTLEIRKEFFYPGEKVSSPACSDLIFKQLYRDTYDGNCVRLTDLCTNQMKMAFEGLMKPSAGVSEPMKVQTIEKAKQLPVYFSKVFAVQDLKDKQVKFLVLASHNMSLLFKHSPHADELAFAFTIAYEDMPPVTLKDQSTLLITPTRRQQAQVQLHIHTPNAPVIFNLINDYKQACHQVSESSLCTTFD